MDDMDVLRSSVKQQRENVRVWKEGYDREEQKLTDMRNLLNAAEAEVGVTDNGGED